VCAVWPWIRVAPDSMRQLGLTVPAKSVLPPGSTIAISTNLRIFSNREACLRLVTALAVEQADEWVVGRRYLDMEELEEQRQQEREANEVMLIE
jgi:hypothetical protein